MSVLGKDTELKFPHVLIVEASAGSGKTHTLAKRFVQFLLSSKIPNSELSNILAITFTNNAAREMKERILEWLKILALEIDSERYKYGDVKKETLELVEIKPESIKERAKSKIEEILNKYTDFQVSTIDSFASRILMASCDELGFPPQFEITMSQKELLDYTIDLWLQDIVINGRKDLFDKLMKLCDEISGEKNTYKWDPVYSIQKTFYGMIEKEFQEVGELVFCTRDDNVEDIISQMKSIVAEMDKIAGGVVQLKKGSVSKYNRFKRALENKDLYGILKEYSLKCPFAKGGLKRGDLERYFEVESKWGTLKKYMQVIAVHYAFTHYSKFRDIWESFKSTLEMVKRKTKTLYIQDINKKLSQYLRQDVVPEIYYKLGNFLYHFLMDEFQDTDKVQWQNLLPLIHEALSKGGSFFAVGDLKQAIYMFRNADYKIMKELIQEVENNKAQKKTLPMSVSKSSEVRRLKYNYRSGGVILNYVDSIFKGKLKEYLETDVLLQDRSGLTSYEQFPLEGKEKEGYVFTKLVLKTEKDETPEKDLLYSILDDVRERYRWGDIAILALKNEHVREVVKWLNERDIPVASFSSLDIRNRRIVMELISLLRFLNSPIDNLSFATFIMGDIFREALKTSGFSVDEDAIKNLLFSWKSKDAATSYLYIYFRNHPAFEPVWKKFFEKLIKNVGFYSLYDLLVLIYRDFEVFKNFREEHGFLIKLLDYVHGFEKKGLNNIGDFLEAFENADEEELSVTLPDYVDAVRVMTVHKSKGLGFPVVINLLYQDGKKRSNRKGIYYFKNPDGELIPLKLDAGVYKILKDSSSDEAVILRDLYDEAKTDEEVQFMNELYVCTTRAMNELYNIIVLSNGTGKKEKKWPEIFEDVEQGTKIRVVEKPLGRKALYHEAIIPENLELSFKGEEGEIWTVERLLDTRRGEFFHEIMRTIDYIEGDPDTLLDSRIEKAQTKFKEKFDPKKVKKILKDFLKIPEVSEWFERKPGRIILKEADFASRNGSLYRMDRVLIDQDSIVVIDFKTGEMEEQHRNQLRLYMKILQGIFPGKLVKGYLGYIDLKRIEAVT